MKLKKDLSIQLGPYLNLFERIVNKDTPRSIALAKRTYQRSSIDRENINNLIKDERKISDVNQKLDVLEFLKKNKNFKSKIFIKNMNLLKELLS